MTNISTEHKNNVFCLLYQDKKYLLSLYNAVNGTDYRNLDELEVVTLEHAICLSMKNDAAFVIDSRLNLYEHQSTANANIPLRDLYYVTEEYRKLVTMEQLHKRTRTKIPAPRFAVFYNGIEPQPEKKIWKLSDLYEVSLAEPELELTVTQYNINKGYNAKILENCESLKGYMSFVEKVRGKTESGTDVKAAVREAVEECIREDILADFFREHKSEVIEMGIYEFDAEAYERVLKEENWELGHDEGLTEGKNLKLIQLICRKLTKHKPLGLIAEELEEDPTVVKAICDIAAKYAPKYDVEKILAEYHAAEGTD